MLRFGVQHPENVISAMNLIASESFEVSFEVHVGTSYTNHGALWRQYLSRTLPGALRRDFGVDRELKHGAKWFTPERGVYYFDLEKGPTVDPERKVEAASTLNLAGLRRFPDFRGSKFPILKRNRERVVLIPKNKAQLPPREGLRAAAGSLSRGMEMQPVVGRPQRDPQLSLPNMRLDVLPDSPAQGHGNW